MTFKTRVLLAVVSIAFIGFLSRSEFTPNCGQVSEEPTYVRVSISAIPLQLFF